jgi:hypothetical protein
VPDAVYTLNLTTPIELVRGQTATLAPVVRSEADAVVTPTTWAAQLYRGEAQLLTGSGSGAVSVSFAIPSTYTLADDYSVRWQIVHASGRLDLRHRASVVLTRLYPTLTAAEIYARAPALNPSAAGALRIFGSGQSVMTVAAEAWRDLVAELRSRGVRPRLIVDPDDLRAVHLQMTLALVFRSVASTLNETSYLEHARDAEQHAASLWARLSLTQAPADPLDGGPAAATSRAPVMGGAWGDTGRARYSGEPATVARGVR